jgi:hypothetical protein
MKKQNYYYILHLLAGITIGFLLFGCGLDDYKYRIVGKVIVKGDTLDAIAYTNDYVMMDDSVIYYNSDSSMKVLYSPYTIYENQSRK